MTWFKVDDTFHSHPKVLSLSDSAVALWLKAGTWSAQHLTDGHVPAAVLRVLGYRDRIAAELVTAGLWRHHHHDGWVFHDWHGYQPTRADVEARRAADRKRQEKARHKARDHGSGRFSVIDGDGDVTGGVTA